MTIAEAVRREVALYRPDAPITILDLRATSRELAHARASDIVAGLREVAEPHPGYPTDKHSRTYWRRLL